MTRTTTSAAFLIAMGLGCVQSASAAIVFTIQQSGPDVVATGSGSLDLTGIGSPSGGFQAARVAASIGDVVVGVSANADNYIANFSGDPLGFGSGGLQLANFTSGNLIGVGDSGFGGLLLSLPLGYTSGALSGSATWSGTDLATLGITPGTYSWTLDANSDTITLNVVPEPTSLAPLLSLGLACAYVGYRRAWKRR